MAIIEAAETGGARRRFRVRHPVTREPIGEFDAATEEDVAEAIAKARKAQRSWARRTVADRARTVARALDVLLKRQDDYIDVIMKETGRSRLETTFMEIFATADSINFYTRRARKVLEDRSIGLHLLRMKKAQLVWQPLGVIGIITPWNGPFVLSLNPTVQALLGGNAVILKPSEITPFSGRLVEDLFREAGLPEGLVQVLLGDGKTGAALVKGGVDKISFTGSVEVGRKIGAACGRQLIPCTLELGGKDPMIICGDADLDRAAAGAVFGAFMNAGQYCSSTERVYVVDAVADAFTHRVVKRVEALRLGPGDEFDIGPFILDRQIKIVERHVKDAVKKGALVLTGGKRTTREGASFYEPTVLSQVTHDMAVMTQETFGPVLPIMRCRHENEAVHLANDTPYGLGATVWSKNRRRAIRLARRLQCGSVTLNDASVTYGALEVPFGGRKSSGVGAVNGTQGILGYCAPQPIIIDRIAPKEEQIWYPYTADKLEGLKKALKVIWGTPLKKLM